MNYLKILFLFCVGSCFGQNLVVTSVDAGGATATTGNLQVLYTIGEVNVQEFSGSIKASEGFIIAPFKIKIDPIVFLQGPLFNQNTIGLMNDDLRANNYIPTTSPYADQATVDTSVFTVTGNNAIVDWVWVELREENENTKIVASTSALLQRDGDVVGLDGNASLVLNAAPDNYYVVIKHRNHLGVMSANPISLERDVVAVINFSDSSIPTFGTHAQVALPSTLLGLWAGNVNGDTVIQYSGTNPDVPSILSEVLNDPGNFLNFPTYIVQGYNVHDVNMDGKTQYTGTEPDTPFILQNVIAHPGNFLNFSTYQIQEQLPEH
jgi:hypothetical protein